MSEQIQAPTKSRDLRAWIGYPLTGLYLLGLGAHLYVTERSPLALELNAMGDFLAGVFGPLAFLWLVLGYLQQGEELQQNTRALEDQEKRLAETTAEQAKLAKATLDLVAVTRQQLAEERDRHHEALQRRRRASEPNLKLQGHITERTQTSIEWGVSVRNVGKRCADFTLKAANEDITAFMSCHVLEELPTGEQLSLGLRQCGNLFPRVLTAHYIDADGEPGTQEFEARIVEFEHDNLALCFTRCAGAAPPLPTSIPPHPAMT